MQNFELSVIFAFRGYDRIVRANSLCHPFHASLSDALHPRMLIGALIPSQVVFTYLAMSHFMKTPSLSLVS